MLGLVVNPVAGIGGPAGLAGSDGAAVQRDALARGARPRALERAAAALRVVAAAHPGATVLTAAGAMGADAVRAAGLVPQVVYVPGAGPGLDPGPHPVHTSGDPHRHAAAAASTPGVSGPIPAAVHGSAGLDAAAAAGPDATTPADTTAAVRALAAAGATLILFAGGDGTARDAASGFDPMPGRAAVGIPAGVKMYSPVFAVSSSAAGALAASWLDAPLPVHDQEVLDVDEQAMRRARVEPVLFGMLPVPYVAGRTQARKSPTPVSEHAAVVAAAHAVARAMRPGVRYLLGPGSTTAEIARVLGVPGTPLGVDVVLDGRVVVTAASERELLDEIARGPAKAVVTVIGGQGFLLGRGNQQLSAAVVRALGPDPLIVVAPEQKLIDLRGRPLLVDTGDAALDASLQGFTRVVTGAGSVSMYPVVAADDETSIHPTPDEGALHAS